ncbi:MAG: adenylate/guanylate cyclase domain-containing protein, partial [Chlamydiota bacterium]
PYGISSFTINPDKNFNGLSMLTSDLFFERSLTTTTSKEGSYLLIDNPLLKEVFMAATTDIATSSGSYSVTIGSSLSPLLSQLITNLEAIAIISENNKPYVAINPAGLSLPHAAIEKLSLEATAKEPYGIVEFNNVRYQFMKIEPFVDSHLAIIILRPESIDPLTSLHTTILKELNKTSDTLAWQLLGINLFILIAALIILVFLSRAVTKPVRQLAFATEALAKGNYAEIDFPSITADSKDEVSILNEGFKNMVIALRDKEKMRAVLDKVVSKEIAAEILKGHIHLGGENRIMTVMFADIRNFTHMSEKIEPERLILFLNKFMTKMSFIIEEHYGVIDKYVGDEIMALYGAPHLDADSARKAVETALLMVSELKKWNIERVAEGFPEINIGIGINTGKMVVGNMGAENRLNYTVLGSNVNLGARLCSKAEPMQILVSETTLETCGLKDSLEFQEIEALLLKGFSEPVKAFSILGFKK